MNHCLTIRNRQRIRPVNVRPLRNVVRTLLAELLHVPRADLGIYLVAAPEMTWLNETFVHHAGSTDVIAFDYARAGRASSRSQSSRPIGLIIPGDRSDACPVLHGEIFVCLDEAIAQARRFHTSWQSEIVRYAIHGVLHLRGYRDTSPAARRKMKREEDRLHRLLAERFAFGKLAA